MAEDPRWARGVARAAAGGVVAAMAMSGMRLLTIQLGLVDEAPPESIVKQKMPSLLQVVPSEYRPVLTELMHWGYGAVAGAVFGGIPRSIRRHRWAGPLYGLGTWALFEGGIAPGLGLEQAEHPRVTERIMLAIDHALYGVIVARTH